MKRKMKRCKICNLPDFERELVRKLLNNEGHHRKVTPLSCEQISFVLWILFNFKVSRYTLYKHKKHVEIEENDKEESFLEES